jgi:hypothetical protein
VAEQADVTRIALALPGVTCDDGLHFSVGGKGFAWPWMERVDPKKPRVARPDILAVRVANEGEKLALIKSDPEKFFTEAHYNGFPAVLVRIAAVGVDEIAELIADAWRTKAPKALVKEYDARA